MKLVELQIYNRAPFDNLNLKFANSNLAVLSGINGAGKTTIISYLVDSFYELAKKGFASEFESVQNKYYRISSTVSVLDNSKLSFVYFRFQHDEGNFDYIDIRNLGAEEEFSKSVSIESPIAYATIKQKIKDNTTLKYSTLTDKNKIVNLFNNQILTYFPAYRYEVPSYLNDPYKVTLNFHNEMSYTGFLTNPIEVTSDIPDLANWIMDIILDAQLYKGTAQNTQVQINSIFTALLKSKIKVPVRLGIGPRHSGATRIQVINQVTGKSVYPSIFSMSSGELALLSLFGELIRQADNLGYTFSSISGIVLVDEIDKHLHIKLQKEVLPQLIKLFPHIQFIVTSHSPFFNLGLSSESPTFYRIFDLDNHGLLCTPQCNELFNEVYEMMVTENARYARKYEAILAETQKATIPMVITEGKTDWKHLKSAMKALGISDLNIEFYEYEETMGDIALMQLLEQFSIIAPNRKIIGIFDRDNEVICSKINGTGKSYIQLSPNIYALSIPVANEVLYGPYTSIEHYYKKEQLLKYTQDGRRLFLGEEFFESGMSKTHKYLTRFKGIQNKVKVNGIIDEKVFSLQDDPEFKNSVALSKDKFAQLIYEQDEYAQEFDFSEFSKIFCLLRDILGA